MTILYWIVRLSITCAISNYVCVAWVKARRKHSTSIFSRPTDGKEIIVNSLIPIYNLIFSYQLYHAGQALLNQNNWRQV